MKKVYLGLIVLVAVFGVSLVAYSYSGYAPGMVCEDGANCTFIEAVKEATLGAFSGPDVYHYVNVHDRVHTGGGVLVASSSLAVGLSLTATQVCENSVISTTHKTPSGPSNVAITLPATSTLWSQCLTENGAETSFLFCNESTAAASTTTMTAGTGGDLMEPGDGDIHDVIINGLNCARITLTRYELGNLDLVVEVKELSPAD